MAPQPGPARAELEAGWAVSTPDRPRRPIRQTQRRVFVAILVGWNLAILVLVLVELSIRHRPNVQIGASNIVLGILTDSWVVVNLAILATALMVRWWGRKRERTSGPATGEIGT